VRKRKAIACLIGFSLFFVTAAAQTSGLDPIKLKALQARYQELASRYQQSCDSIDHDMNLDLLRIEQGAVLAGGIDFPMTMEIVAVLRNMQKQINDDACNRAKEYSNLAEIIGDMLQ
jgi:ABC-type transporter Mla maintaining outer membrane lipid asymmetry ATPase subunit MlaF